MALDDYLAGFVVNGVTVRGVISGAVRLWPRTPVGGGFLVASNAATSVSSGAGVCGLTLELPKAAAAGDNIRLRYCDGSQASDYQLDLSGTKYDGSLTDLASPGGRATLFGAGASTLRVGRQNGVWTAAPMTLRIAAGGLVNAASFTADLAPGGIASIYGIGFGRTGVAPGVQVNGVDARVLAAFPFQINFQVPADTPPGAASVSVQSDYGTGVATTVLKDVAPALFTISATQGAILNSDGTINGVLNPAKRGDVVVAFGTGLGSREFQGQFDGGEPGGDGQDRQQ